MHSGKLTELFDTIFKVFPKASILRKSELKPCEQTKRTTNEKPGLAKRVKARRAVLLACKLKVLSERELSLFNDGRSGK